MINTFLVLKLLLIAPFCKCVVHNHLGMGAVAKLVMGVTP